MASTGTTRSATRSSGSAPPAKGEATTLIVTGIPWRTGWKYAERGFRHIYWDAGSMLAQTLALAESAGLGPRLWTRFADAEVHSLVGADGVQEFPLAIVGLGHGRTGDPACRGGSQRLRRRRRRSNSHSSPSPSTRATRTARRRRGQPSIRCVASHPHPTTSRPSSCAVGRRGSWIRTPRSIATRSTSRSQPPLSGSHASHFVAVHAVEGLDPGLYRWPDLDRPVRRGLLREELLRACWDQDLGRDAAFVVMSAIDLDFDRRPGLPRSPARRRHGLRSPSSGRLRARDRRVGDDVPRLRRSKGCSANRWRLCCSPASASRRTRARPAARLASQSRSSLRNRATPRAPSATTSLTSDPWHGHVPPSGHENAPGCAVRGRLEMQCWYRIPDSNR